MKISVRGITSKNSKLNDKFLFEPVEIVDNVIDSAKGVSIITLLIDDYNIADIAECISLTKWVYKDVGTRKRRKLAREARLNKINKVKAKDLFKDDELPF